MAVETRAQERRRPPKFANSIAALILRSPIHGMMSSFLVLLTFSGRKSGKQYTIPVGYGRKGNTLSIFTDNKWYKNLQVNPQVKVRLQGKERSGTAEVILGEKERTAQEMQDFVSHSKQAARAYGVTFDVDGSVNQESLRKAAENWVLIVVHLT